MVRKLKSHEFNDALKSEYEALFSLMRINPQQSSTIASIVKRIQRPEALRAYRAVENITGVPWHVVAIMHSLEAELKFECHLHNGDPLTARTVREPTGRPRTGAAPFDWVQSAADALTLDQLDRWNDWSIGGTAFALEVYNGMGYRRNFPHVKSPYLWSFSSIYTRGKYVSDGRFDPNTVSRQCGGMVLLKALCEAGMFEFEALKTPKQIEAARPTPHIRPGDGSREFPFPAPIYPGLSLRRGSIGADVATIQKRLKDVWIDTEEIDGDFGEVTEYAVKFYQVRSTDVDGVALEIDGIVGAKTWAALFGPGSVVQPAVALQKGRAPRTGRNGTSTIALRALEIADNEIGVREVPFGSNRGPRVDVYLSTVDEDLLGNPWCMAFVYWCFEEASKSLEVRNPLPRTAHVLDSWDKTIRLQNAIVVKADEARRDPSLITPGMIFYINTGGRRGHTGLVVDEDEHMLVTIEGNTNDDGSREGIGVYRRNRRHIRNINLGFVGFN